MDSTCYSELGKRQEWELALSEKPKSLETRLYHFAMRNKANQVKADTRPPDHPIHRLAALEQSLLQTANPQRLAQTFCRKRRQQLEAQAEPPTVSSLYISFNSILLGVHLFIV